MRSKGPYLALHLGLEKDVWVRAGCLPGLTPEHDEIVRAERKLTPELLTGRSNMACRRRSHQVRSQPLPVLYFSL
ncbi:unnamed protein product [Musa acuminata subsp. malaccensis]|uniref:(wild Malaysian banana) hypothetical protein n=1 Tax=Musa acuminata subsp. malaccensis TaxID=214687 RepID=A0A804J9B4_MUSAM|nr:unnamed protein product [Musa acuminata subsp. malaccensis]